LEGPVSIVLLFIQTLRVYFAFEILD